MVTLSPQYSCTGRSSRATVPSSQSGTIADLQRITPSQSLPRQGRAISGSYENSTDDSRLRPSTVASSVGPQASKNWTSCLRAPSSFHLRSRLTIGDQVVDRFLPASLAVEGDREIEAGLMIERIGGHVLFQLGDRADRFRLLGELERGARGRDRGIVAAWLPAPGPASASPARWRRCGHSCGRARPAPGRCRHPARALRRRGRRRRRHRLCRAPRRRPSADPFPRRRCGPW